MPSVRIRDNESFEVALRRFKRTCEKAGVLTDVRKHEYFEKPSQERKRKRAAAIKRQLKRQSRDSTSRRINEPLEESKPGRGCSNPSSRIGIGNPQSGIGNRSSAPEADIGTGHRQRNRSRNGGRCGFWIRLRLRAAAYHRF